MSSLEGTCPLDSHLKKTKHWLTAAWAAFIIIVSESVSFFTGKLWTYLSGAQNCTVSVGTSACLTLVKGPCGVDLSTTVKVYDNINDVWYFLHGFWIRISLIRNVIGIIKRKRQDITSILIQVRFIQIFRFYWTSQHVILKTSALRKLTSTISTKLKNE